jgi:hypothetical protein
VGVTIESYGKHYQILMILDNVEFLPPIFMPCFGSHFENGRHLDNFEKTEFFLNDKILYNLNWNELKFKLPR